MLLNRRAYRGVTCIEQEAPHSPEGLCLRAIRCSMLSGHMPHLAAGAALWHCWALQVRLRRSSAVLRAPRQSRPSTAQGSWDQSRQTVHALSQPVFAQQANLSRYCWMETRALNVLLQRKILPGHLVKCIADHVRVMNLLQPVHGRCM